MAERRRRPAHRPRLAPPRAAARPPRPRPEDAFVQFRRSLRGPLDRLSAAVDRPQPAALAPAAALRAAIWRAPFWLWLLLAFFSALPMAAPTPFALIGMAAGGAAAAADTADFRRLSVAGLRERDGAPAPAELRWIAALAAGGHGFVAGAAALISAAPALIGLLGGYAW